MADEALPSQEFMMKQFQDALDAEARKAEKDQPNRDVGSKDLISDDQKLFGLVELSPQMHSMVRIGLDWLDPYVRKYGEDFLRTAGSKALANTIAKGDPVKAEAIARTAANALGWAYVLKRPFIGGFVGAKALHNDRADLAERLQPLMRAEGIMSGGHGSLTKAGLDGNEILKVEHERIGSKFKYNMYRDVGAELIVTAPQVLLKLRDNERLANGEGDPFKAKDGESQNDFRKRQREEAKQYLEELKADGFEGESLQTMLNNQLKAGQRKAAAIENPKISDDLLQSLGPAFGAIGTSSVRQSITSREKKNSSHLEETALDKIEKIYEQALEHRRIKKIDGKDLKAYVKDIFQTHQKNMGQKHIGERLDEKLDYAAEKIAEAIERGRMHPMALVHLVGERLVVQKEGKYIVPGADIDAALDVMCQKMPAKFDVDADVYLGESTMTEDDLKHILGNLHGQARDLFIEIIPDEVLIHVGMSEEEIHTTHQRNKKEFGKLLTTALMDIASMSKEELKEAKLTDKEIDVIYDAASKGKTGEIKSVLLMVSTHGEFSKGVDWPLASMKDYWLEVANGQRQIGEEYKKNGEELTPEREAREQEEFKAAKEAEKKSAKELDRDDDTEHESSHAKDDNSLHHDDDGGEELNEEGKKPKLAHESKLMSEKKMSSKHNPFDDEQAANDESLDIPGNHVTSAAHHDKIDAREAAHGGRS